jgi:uncharacterized protein
MVDLSSLTRHLQGLGRVLLGYSGGVDSALLGVTGARAAGPDRFLAVIGRSPSYPAVQYAAAIRVAREFEVPLLEVATEEMDDPDYVANPVNRCYFCKQELWRRLQLIATIQRFDAIIDGTNADDLGEHRPGMGAAREYGIRSPLAELGWSKVMIREAAKELGIPIWDAPAAPCLSSRVIYGLPVTVERLRQIEAGEALLREIGVLGDLRARHHGDHVRIEVGPEEIALVQRCWPRVLSGFQALGIEDVRLDPKGYRRGGLLTELPVLSG